VVCFDLSLYENMRGERIQLSTEDWDPSTKTGGIRKSVLQIYIAQTLW